jgi:hypothetical protein
MNQCAGETWMWPPVTSWCSRINSERPPIKLITLGALVVNIFAAVPLCQINNRTNDLRRTKRVRIPNVLASLPGVGQVGTEFAQGWCLRADAGARGKANASAQAFCRTSETRVDAEEQVKSKEVWLHPRPVSGSGSQRRDKQHVNRFVGNR